MPYLYTPNSRPTMYGDAGVPHGKTGARQRHLLISTESENQSPESIYLLSKPIKLQLPHTIVGLH